MIAHAHKTLKKNRLKVMKSALSRGHRYNWVRMATQSMTLAILVGVPLSGLAQVDAWRGNHFVLFKPAPFEHALAGVIVGIVACYVVTFLINIVAGRLFCGWGCPVGQVSRLGEAVDTPGIKPGQRMRYRVEGALFSGALVLSMFAWWTDPRVLLQGDGQALGIGWGVMLAGAAVAYGHGRWWRWEFCKNVCPIGMYYSIVAPAKFFGVHFDASHDTCIDCGVCDRVCPVQLEPRDLMKPVTDERGLSTVGAPGHNHCLECGDCVRACEFMVGTKGLTPVPLTLGWQSKSDAASPIDSAAPLQS